MFAMLRPERASSTIIKEEKIINLRGSEDMGGARGARVEML